MRNRAKCKLCNSIIESFHPTDYVMCTCNEISVDGGQALRCAAKNWDNFLRIDDEDREFSVKVTHILPNESSNKSTEIAKPKRKEILDMLLNMIVDLERLPQHAMSAPITHYDWMSLLLLLSAIFKAED